MSARLQAHLIWAGALTINFGCWATLFAVALGYFR